MTEISKAARLSATRRALIAGTAAGVAAVGGTILVGRGTPALAAGGSGVTDWINAVKDYQADPTGKTDSTTAIQNALNAAPRGGVVYLPVGTYLTSAPLVLPSVTVTVAGDTGAMQSGAGSPGVGTIITPSPWAGQGSAPANAVFVGGAAPRQTIQDLWIDGTNASGVTGLEGIDFSTSNGGHSLYRVGINNITSWGVYASGFLGWYADTLIIQKCGALVFSQHLDNGAAGGYYCGATDAYHHNVHAQSNTGYGIDIHGGNHRLVACRADWSTLRGYYLYSFNGGSGLGYGVYLTGCASQSNQQEGYCLAGGGHTAYGPYFLSNCQSISDGQGGTYAAVNCVGRVQVSLSDLEVSGNGTYPAYAVGTAKNSGTSAVPDIVVINGGLWQVGTAYINDAGPATKLAKGTSIWGVKGAINGSSGTTTFSNV